MLVVLYYLTVIFFVVVILGGILRLAGFSIFKLLRYLREELMIVLGTASSDAVLPQIMRKLEHMGIKDSTVGLVIPTGYSFNLDAFSIYLTLATVFIAQATNTPLAFMDLMLILAVALLTSKGAHGIPGSAIVVLAATLSAVPVIPAIGLVLVLSVDWFMGMARALGNMTGNCVATVVIAAWEGDIDRERAHQVLNGEDLDPTEAGALRARARAEPGLTPTRRGGPSLARSAASAGCGPGSSICIPDGFQTLSRRRFSSVSKEKGRAPPGARPLTVSEGKSRQTLSSIQPFSEAFGAAPVRLEMTSPSLNMKSAGMPRTPYWAGRSGSRRR